MRSIPRMDESGNSEVPAGRICSHGFDLDCIEGTAHYRGIALALTGTEFELLRTFLEAEGVTLSRDQLSDCVLLQPFDPLGRGLDMLISRLRRKLNVDDNPGRAIRTIRSAGYVFKAPHTDFFQPPASLRDIADRIPRLDSCLEEC